MSNGVNWENEAREELIWEMSEQVELDGNLFLEEEFGIASIKDFDKFSTSKLMEIANRVNEICG